MFYALLTMPAASSTIALVGQDVPEWFAQISPALVLIGVPIALVTLSILAYTIINGFNGLKRLFGGHPADGYHNNLDNKHY